MAVADVHQRRDLGTVPGADHGSHIVPDRRPVPVPDPIADSSDWITDHGPDPDPDRVTGNPDAYDGPTKR